MFFVRSVRSMSVFAAAFSLAACSGIFEGKAASIAARYDLSAIDGQTLPWQSDSSGVRMTTISGTLTLDSADPEPFVTTPAGLYPSSCVHEVPSGTTVTEGMFPPCGDGTFALSITRRYDYPDGSTHTATAVNGGKYAWSADDPSLIMLVGAQMSGSVVRSSSATQVSLQATTIQGAYGPKYTFSTTP